MKVFFNNIHETDEKLTSEAAVSFVGSRVETGIFWPLDDDQGDLLRSIDNCGTSPLEGSWTTVSVRLGY